MTDAFDQLKAKAAATEAQDKAAVESWARRNRGWLIGVAAAFTIGLILGLLK